MKLAEVLAALLEAVRQALTLVLRELIRQAVQLINSIAFGIVAARFYLEWKRA